MKLERLRFWKVLAPVAAVVTALAMLAAALLLLAGMAGGAEVALAAPPEQGPDCINNIDVEGKTPEEVLEELEACLAQGGGIGIQGTKPFTEVITIDKSLIPGKNFYGKGEVVTFTISLTNSDVAGIAGLQIFNWRDWLPMVGPCPQQKAGEFIAVTTSGAGAAVGAYADVWTCCDWPACTISHTAPTVAGVGWLMGGQSVDINITYEITECQSLFIGNHVDAWDALYAGDWYAAGVYVADTVDLPLESVRITKTVEPEGPVSNGDRITYTVSIENYGCDDVRVMMADDIDWARLEGDFEGGWTVPGGTGWWGTGTGWWGTGSNYLGGGTLYPPGTSVYKPSFLYFTGTVSSTNVLTLTIPALVRDVASGTITNTAEFWLWDMWWETTGPPWWPGTVYSETVTTNPIGPPAGVFLPVILKNSQ